MKWLWAVPLILSPAIIYGLALLAAAVVAKFYRGRCRNCGQRGVKRVNWIRAHVLIDGKPACDTWSYYVCERCGTALKYHRGQWEDIDEYDKPFLKPDGADVEVK